MKNIFSDKRLRYGTYSTFTALVVIAIAVVVNLIAGSINYKKDLTPNSIFAVTDDTKTVLDNVKNNVNIYAMYQTGQEDSVVLQILDQYENANSNIKVQTKDPVLYPQFVEKYTADGSTVSTGSIIVESGDRYKVIDSSDIYTQGTDYMTGEATQNVAAEAQITGAIQYVTIDELPVICNITGHNEMSLQDLGSELAANLSTANYEIRDVDLLEEDIPSDCSLILATTPDRDYTADEAKKITDYLANDGRALFLIDYKYNTFENVSSILANYGVSLDNPIIFEGDSKYQFQNYPTAILPDIAIHDATKDMGDTAVLFTNAYGITELPEKRVSTTIEPLLTTSASSFGRVGESESVSKTDSDVPGPFNTAVAITDNTYTDSEHTTKLIVCSGYYYLLFSQADMLVSYGNSDFVMGCINWLNDKKDMDTINISPKSLTNETFTTDYASSERVKYICVVLLPLFIIGMGFVVWFSRRNK